MDFTWEENMRVFQLYFLVGVLVSLSSVCIGSDTTSKTTASSGAGGTSNPPTKIGCTSSDSYPRAALWCKKQWIDCNEFCISECGKIGDPNQQTCRQGCVALDNQCLKTVAAGK